MYFYKQALSIFERQKLAQENCRQFLQFCDPKLRKKEAIEAKREVARKRGQRKSMMSSNPGRPKSK